MSASNQQICDSYSSGVVVLDVAEGVSVFLADVGLEAADGESHDGEAAGEAEEDVVDGRLRAACGSLSRSARLYSAASMLFLICPPPTTAFVQSQGSLLRSRWLICVP